MRLLTEKYKLIILSILIALLLWFYVNDQDNNFSVFISNMKNDTIKTLFIDIGVKNLPDDLKIEELSSDKVAVRLDEVYLFSNYKREDFSAYIDVDGINEGDNVRLVKINSPDEVKIKEINPEYIQIKVSKK